VHHPFFTLSFLKKLATIPSKEFFYIYFYRYVVVKGGQTAILVRWSASPLPSGLEKIAEKKAPADYRN
jgi:hypothetical protein